VQNNENSTHTYIITPCIHSYTLLAFYYSASDNTESMLGSILTVVNLLKDNPNNPPPKHIVSFTCISCNPTGQCQVVGVELFDSHLASIH